MIGADDFTPVARRKLAELVDQGGYLVNGVALESAGGRPCWINRFGMVLWPRLEHSWKSSHTVPPVPGDYLTVQIDANGTRYRWVRRWTGAAWVGTSPEKYGDVFYWMELPGYPESVASDCHDAG